jgi:hypothetical protein
LLLTGIIVAGSFVIGYLGYRLGLPGPAGRVWYTEAADHVIERAALDPGSGDLMLLQHGRFGCPEGEHRALYLHRFSGGTAGWEACIKLGEGPNARVTYDDGDVKYIPMAAFKVQGDGV